LMPANHFTDPITPDDSIVHTIHEVILSTKTPFQELQIVDIGTFGRALILDGRLQSTTGDEFLYHEPLVHPACVSHGAPRTALVLGGGEGATIRELLKWSTIERIAMVDLDEQVVRACREHLSKMHRGAFDDRRVELVFADALEFVASSHAHPSGGWDVIISDLTEPIPDGPSVMLFTREFFEDLRRILSPRGRLLVQAGSLGPTELANHARLSATIRSVFENASTLCSTVPSFPDQWGFVLASDEPIDRRPDPDAIDALLADRVIGELRMFDGRSLLGMLQPARHIRDAIGVEQRIYTRADAPRLFDR